MIEVADSSLAYDRGRKAKLYAKFGIRELWVIDAVKLTTFIYRHPEKGFVNPVMEKAKDERLEALLILGLSVTVGSPSLR